MNIENGTSADLKEGMEITISQRVKITDVGSNYVTVEDEDGDEIDVTDASDWWITL